TTFSPTVSYTLSLQDALPIWLPIRGFHLIIQNLGSRLKLRLVKPELLCKFFDEFGKFCFFFLIDDAIRFHFAQKVKKQLFQNRQDRKSTRLNSSHVKISYAVF